MTEDEKNEAKSPDEDFATSTTMHGVYFCYTSHSKWAKALWVILILGMIGALVSQVTLRILDYFDYATSTDIAEEFVSYLEFPAITMCSFNRYFMETEDEDMLDAVHAINDMTSPEIMAYYSENDLKPNLSEIAPIEKGFDIKTFQNEHGFSIDENMERCVFKSKDCRANDFKVVFTSMGKCYTFNEGNITKIQNIPGSGHGLGVTLDARQDLYTEEAWYGNREAGIKIQIHPPYESPNVATYGISIPVGMKASVEITRRDHNMMYRPWGRCDPARESLKYFSTYTLNNCVEECYTDAVISECGCHVFTQYWAQGHADECTIQQMYDCASEFLITLQQNYSASDCECSIPCKYTTYGLTVSYAAYPNQPNIKGFQEWMNRSAEYVRSNLLEFDVYFRTLSYSTFSQSKKVSESSLLSDIGGQLGLWLGMSVITTVEIVQFLVSKIARSRQKKTKVHDKNGGSVAT